MDYVKEFLTLHTIEDVVTEVTGEWLPEFCTENANYVFGNGELLVYPTNSDDASAIVYVVDTIGFGPVLVRT